MRYAILLTGLLLPFSSWAREESWLGIYIQGQKIGHMSVVSTPQGLDGKPGSRTDSTTVIGSKMLGTALSMRVTSTSWLDGSGRPVRMKFVTESSNRSQTVLADFGPKEIAVQIDNTGTKSTKTIAIPDGAEIVEDATTAFLTSERPPVGKTREFYVLDPTTVSLIKNTATYQGKRSTTVKGKSVEADLIEIQDPRATSKVYLSAKGDLVKMEGPLGMELLPETKAEAMAEASPDKPLSDIAFATAIDTTPKIERPERLKGLKLAITGLALDRLPADGHQSVRRVGDAWEVDIHPVQATVEAGATIESAKKGKEEWLKPAMHMPSDDATFRDLAKQIVGDDKTILGATAKIRDAVFGMMRANAGIGVLRDAKEVLATKEGVCRDYAILTTTLMRAAGIPTKLVSGLLATDGQLFYHAWVEVWTGKEWIGVDTTRPEKTFSAAHLKIAKGNVEEAFVFFVFDGAKVRVLETKY